MWNDHHCQILGAHNITNSWWYNGCLFSKYGNGRCWPLPIYKYIYISTAQRFPKSQGLSCLYPSWPSWPSKNRRRLSCSEHILRRILRISLQVCGCHTCRGLFTVGKVLLTEDGIGWCALWNIPMVSSYLCRDPQLHWWQHWREPRKLSFSPSPSQ